jgi:hypothetical protein
VWRAIRPFGITTPTTTISTTAPGPTFILGDPAFWDYNPDDHDLHDGSWADFFLTAASSNAIDTGTTVLPDSLTTLLDGFDVDDHYWGAALDIGRYEAGFAILPTPSTQVLEPGGTVHFALSLYPSDLPHTVTLTAASPSPSLTLTLDPGVVGSGTVGTLTVTDSHAGSVLAPGLRYTLPITGTSGGFTQTTSVNLLVGGEGVYLPLITRE